MPFPRSHPDLPIACDLSRLGPSDRAREQELLTWFRATAALVEETASGWRFRLPALPADLARVGELLAYERLCCPFLEFRLTVTRGEEAVLEVSGGPQAKPFIAAEFG